MTRRINIPYFPTGIRYATPALAAAGIYLWIIGYPYWMGVLILLGMIVLTAHYVTEIDLDKMEYRDFVSVLWMPFAEEKVAFKSVDKIVIQKVNHSQMLNSRSRSRGLDWSSFTGTLIMDGDKTLDLLTRTDKAELISGLKEFVDFLKVKVEDHTTGQTFTIDMSKY